MLIQNFEICSIKLKNFLKLYNFLTNLDEKTVLFFHDPVIYPFYMSPNSLYCYARLFISCVLPKCVLIKISPYITCCAFTVSVKNVIQAFGFITFKCASQKGSYEAFLGIVVRKNARGLGVGTKLIKKMIEVSRQFKITRLTLTVLAENVAAIKIYKKNGFKIVGKTVDSFGGFQREAFIMDLSTIVDNQ